MKSCMKTSVKTNMYFLKLTLCKKVHNVNDLNQKELALSGKYFR